MSFIGYCTTEELAKFLDIGAWQEDVVLANSYTSNNLSIDRSAANGVYFNLIEGMIKLYDDGVLISSSDYSVDLDTGNITFISEPAVGSKITADYYLVEEFSNSDLEYYITLGAYTLEKDTSSKFREVTITDYYLDVQNSFDYTNNSYTQTYITLPYSPILEVTALEVDGTTVTPSTLKIKQNMVFITDDSEVSHFTSGHDSIKISLKYGITDTVSDRTDNDLLLLSLAKSANLYCSALIISKTPIGRNILYDNSKITQLSKGDVRPSVFNENLTKSLQERYDEIKKQIKGLSTDLI